MRCLLDTNVLSEMVKPRPDPGVVSWIGQQAAFDLFVSSLSFGEIRKGVDLRAPDARRDEIEGWLTHHLPMQFRGRVLPIDAEVALEWGRITARGQKMGRVLPTIDGLLVATCIVHRLALVTRNERDCIDRGALIVNPWSV